MSKRSSPLALRWAWVFALPWAWTAARAQTLPPDHPAVGSGAPSAARGVAAGGEERGANKLVREVDQVRGELDARPLSFESRAALGNLYYENGKFGDAIDEYRRALEIAAPYEAKFAAARAKADAAQQKARRKDSHQSVPQLPAECDRGPEHGLVEVAAAAEAQKDPRAALACWEVALAPAHAARARRANALYLTGDAELAIAEHERLLERAPDYPESLFFLGAMYLETGRSDPQRKAQGRKYWERLLASAPGHPRAAIARETLPRIDEIFGERPEGAPGALPSGHPPVGPAALSADAAEAIANTERGPGFEKGLDQLVAEGEQHLAAGHYEDALIAYRGVMPYRPTDARVAAGMGGALRGLGKPTAERVLQRALELDPGSPRANYEYGRLLYDRGDRAGALARFKTAERDAAFAKSVGLAKLIADVEVPH